MFMLAKTSHVHNAPDTDPPSSLHPLRRHLPPHHPTAQNAHSLLLQLRRPNIRCQRPNIPRSLRWIRTQWPRRSATACRVKIAVRQAEVEGMDVVPERRGSEGGGVVVVELVSY